jgi:hypothetical protein
MRWSRFATTSSRVIRKTAPRVRGAQFHPMLAHHTPRPAAPVLAYRALRSGLRLRPEISADAFGNALGNSIAQGIASSGSQQAAKASSYGNWPDQTDAESARLARSGNAYGHWPDQTGAETARLAMYEDMARPTPEASQAAFRQMERDYRQATDTGATSMAYRAGDNGPFGAALRAASGNRQQALAIYGAWRAQGAIGVDANGLPVVKDGQNLPWVNTDRLNSTQLNGLAQFGAQKLGAESATRATIKAELADAAMRATNASEVQRLVNRSAVSQSQGYVAAGVDRSRVGFTGMMGGNESSYSQSLLTRFLGGSSATALRTDISPTQRDQIIGLQDSSIRLTAGAATTGAVGPMVIAGGSGIPGVVVNEVSVLGRTLYSGTVKVINDVRTLGLTLGYLNNAAGVNTAALVVTEAGLAGNAMAPSALPVSIASKVSFDRSLNEVDRAIGVKAGLIISENPVASASYSRLLNQGTEVRFINNPAISDMGEFDGIRNVVTVNLAQHSSAAEVASTVVHESVHQNRYFNGIPLGTQYEEYLAFRNESLFYFGVRPSLTERQNIWTDVQRMYPHLPQGRSPFGGE